MKRVIDRYEMRAELWGSFSLFCGTFFPLVTNRPFIVSAPPGRESHFISISRALTRCARLETTSLVINVPPGYGKSTLLSMWVAWTLSQYPDSQYLYIAYGHELASKHTAFIKRIVETSAYKDLFGVRIRQDSRAKDFFQTEAGGTIKAFGSSGAITGQDAGLPGLDRFSGALILDDPIKPDEVHSDSIREAVLRNYRETIAQRPRAPNVPIICIAQRLHEADLPAYFMSGQDERQFETLILPALDGADNALYPDVHTKEILHIKKEKSPYVFASQFQQNPIPAGGALFQRDNFPILWEDPDILCTFITADTAETDKSWNDATAFSFWGVYLLDDGVTLALHWIDALELRIEPKDLKDAFLSFHSDCMRYKVPPQFAAIEKKSTGVTLVSVLKETRGLQIREVQRTRASGSKTDRFLEMQHYIASKLISFTQGMFHVEHCIKHMMAITANESHRHDDLADTLSDAIRIALIDKSVYIPHSDSPKKVVKFMANNFRNKMQAINRAHNKS
jgi:predicted phage terminase large subunit-like protein